MRVLIACYSRTGHTETLAQRIAEELKSRGHEVVFERIEVTRQKSRWNLLIRQIYQYPLVLLCLVSASWRRWWLKHYIQPEDDLQPLSHPDVSEFDHVCIGGPKWCYISYPVSRYLRLVQGLRNKKVSAFSTFAGPPFEVFEIELIFEPMRDRIQAMGGKLIATLGLSSNYHELGILPFFQRVTPNVFKRSLESFTIESEYGKEKIKEFVSSLT
jgi:hypothetical protein